MNNRRKIDRFLALAFVPPTLFHAGFSGFDAGFISVGVFFVISGYLMTGLLIVDLDGGIILNQQVF